ncbi:MAG: hypothetical protein IBJ03_04425 [Gemmatimonadaceae bacterium]|nr:hypothetical protein [Gemmatimonadaceae bacterium]
MSRHHALRARIVRVLLVLPLQLVLAMLVADTGKAQTQPDSVRKIVRDSAAGTLAQPDTSHQAEFRRLITTIEQAQVPANIPTSAANLIVLDVRPLVVGGNDAKLTTTLQRHEATVTALRDALQRHEVARGLLESHGIPMSQVLALDTMTKPGSATLYYWPRQ